MKVVEVPREYTVTAFQRIEGQMVVEVSCSNFEEFKALPEAVLFRGEKLGKTGWSSDRGYACYKSGVETVQAIIQEMGTHLHGNVIPTWVTCCG